MPYVFWKVQLTLLSWVRVGSGYSFRPSFYDTYADVRVGRTDLCMADVTPSQQAYGRPLIPLVKTRGAGRMSDVVVNEVWSEVL